MRQNHAQEEKEKSREVVVSRTPRWGGRRSMASAALTDSTRPKPQATPMRAQCSAQAAYTTARASPQSRRGTVGAQAAGCGCRHRRRPPVPAQTKQGKARVSNGAGPNGRTGA